MKILEGLSDDQGGIQDGIVGVGNRRNSAHEDLLKPAPPFILNLNAVKPLSKEFSRRFYVILNNAAFSHSSLRIPPQTPAADGFPHWPPSNAR